MTKYCINCKNINHPCACAHCDGGDNYEQSIDSKNFEKEVRENERDELLDKIRAEIENEMPMGECEEDYCYAGGLDKALEIIDKYGKE